MLRPLEGEPRAAVPSEASLSVLLQVEPRIRVWLRRAQPHRGEWVLLAGALEASPLVGPLRQVLPHQVQPVSPPRELLHPESPRRGRLAGLLVALLLEALLLVALPCQVLPRQALVIPPIQESPPPVQQPQGLLASPPQVEQQQAKHQAVGSSPQGS